MDQAALDMTEGEELNPLTIIRTETALSRFPVHRLAKKGQVKIEIKNQASALLWEVSYNSKYGQPGPLAYKLDTLVINRRIEESGRPVPQIIKLGSLAQIAGELGLNRDTNSVKTALLQNAFAAINAKISYRTIDRTERTLEAAFTRYAVVFTGERLPDGQAADAVYLVFHPIYTDVLNSAVSRPLDFDYMKTLPPAAQRFYEIVSYQIYGALHFQNERAKLRYSDYCLLSTATRYYDFDHVKKQLYKTHRPHLESGYLGKVSYEQTTDAAGQPDWFIYYLPGPNATREYREFTGNVHVKGTKRSKRSALEPGRGEALLLPFPEFSRGAEPEAKPTPTAANTPISPELSPLIERLVAVGVNRADAERFAQAKPDEASRQLEYLAFKADLENPGAYLRAAIEGGYAPPKEYLQAKRKEEQERKKRETTERKVAAEALRMAQEAEKARDADESLSQLEKTQPEAFAAFLAYVEKHRGELEIRYQRMPATIRTKMLASLETPEKRRELFVAWQAERSDLTH